MSPDFWLLVDVRHLSPSECALSLAELFPWVEAGCVAGRAGDPDFLGFHLWLVDLHSDLEDWVLEGVPQLPGLAHNGCSMDAHGLKGVEVARPLERIGSGSSPGSATCLLCVIAGKWLL